MARASLAGQTVSQTQSGDSGQLSVTARNAIIEKVTRKQFGFT